MRFYSKFIFERKTGYRCYTYGPWQKFYRLKVHVCLKHPPSSRASFFELRRTCRVRLRMKLPSKNYGKKPTKSRQKCQFFFCQLRFWHLFHQERKIILGTSKRRTKMEFYCICGGRTFAQVKKHFKIKVCKVFCRLAMYGIFTYIYHILPLKTTKCRKIYHTLMIWQWCCAIFNGPFFPNHMVDFFSGRLLVQHLSLKFFAGWMAGGRLKRHCLKCLKMIYGCFQK